jgi:hypothetical protein
MTSQKAWGWPKFNYPASGNACVQQQLGVDNRFATTVPSRPKASCHP